METITQDVALQTYALDPSHSLVGFVARHLGFSKVRGSFERFEGTVLMAPGDLSTLEAEATIEAASVTTNEPRRDAHLRTSDFFEAETYPTLMFKSTGVRAVAGNTFMIVGELTIRGVTKTVELQAEYLGEGKDPWGGARVGFEAETTVNRKDFGLNWNAVLETGGFLVGDEVQIQLEIQAVQQQDEA
jgi:polyisoprenoid-binding protein YceI